LTWKRIDVTGCASAAFYGRHQLPVLPVRVLDQHHAVVLGAVRQDVKSLRLLQLFSTPRTMPLTTVTAMSDADVLFPLPSLGAKVEA